MYQRIHLPAGPLLGLQILKDISNKENQAIVDLIRSRFQQHGPVRLLVVYEADPGMIGAESFYDNLRFAKQAGEHIARMAVIGKHEWESTWVALFGLFGGIEAQYFNRSLYKAASEWLIE